MWWRQWKTHLGSSATVLMFGTWRNSLDGSCWHSTTAQSLTQLWMSLYAKSPPTFFFLVRVMGCLPAPHARVESAVTCYLAQNSTGM